MTTTYCISGSRSITDAEDIKWQLDQFLLLTKYDKVLIGDASGVDENARAYLRGNNIPHDVYKPNWDKHGKAAGPIRNRAMVERSDIVIAFWDGISRGTLSTIEAAMNLHKELHVYHRTPTNTGPF